MKLLNKLVLSAMFTHSVMSYNDNYNYGKEDLYPTCHDIAKIKTECPEKISREWPGFNGQLTCYCLKDAVKKDNESSKNPRHLANMDAECSHRGYRVNGRCECNPGTGYVGDRCQKYEGSDSRIRYDAVDRFDVIKILILRASVDEECSYRGEIIRGKCQCKPGYGGRRCQHVLGTTFQPCTNVCDDNCHIKCYPKNVDKSDEID